MAGDISNDDADDNQVRLTGTVADTPQLRVLPSGDEVVTVRLVVRRPPSPRRKAPTVDTVDCAAWRAGARRTVSGWAAGEHVAVEGALRRRFWRSPSGPASRYEVEVERGRRLDRA